MTKLDSLDQRLVEIVAEHGWMVQNVAPADGEIEEWFSYTVGLPKSFGWPELICLGLSTSTMHKLLNNAVDECKNGTISPSEGLLLDSVVEDRLVKLISATEWHCSYTYRAQWFAEYSSISLAEFGCLQMLWSDDEGKFPDELGCDPEVRTRQTPIEMP